MITNIILHQVGSKVLNIPTYFAEKELELTNEKKELLEPFFLDSIRKQNQTYRFYSYTDLNQNVVYDAVSKIFENVDALKDCSKEIATYLREVSIHPKIKSGELFIAKFESIGAYNAIGIFKIENHDTFLKLKGGFDASVDVDKGVNLAKVDKAAIIFNNEKESGYVLKIIENNDKISYWKDDFLQVKERDDEFFKTDKMLSLYKDFITEELPEEFEVTKIDQADLLNKSINYFANNENFEFNHFANSVLKEEDLIESFSNYKDDYEYQNSVTISDEFGINSKAVAKGKRSYKSIIKLDKNFHIYVHGNRDLIEQSEDKKGKFYKLYFEQEQ